MLRPAPKRLRRAARYDRRVPLRNRVTPAGDIIVAPERGTMLGNRGILHDGERRIVRTWQVRRWLCCVLAFKGIRRQIMKPGSYTELFFLDEATALAAGHRPCFECRREAARAFQRFWMAAVGTPASANDIDRVLHAERRDARVRARAADLPSCAFVAWDGAAWLVDGGRLHRWSPGGYRDSRAPGGSEWVEVLTPPSTVAVLRAGYVPIVHESAAAHAAKLVAR